MVLVRYWSTTVNENREEVKQVEDILCDWIYFTVDDKWIILNNNYSNDYSSNRQMLEVSSVISIKSV